MKKCVAVVSCSFLLLGGSSFLTGCSAIGYNLGNVIDPAYPAKEVRVLQGMSSLPQNTSVVIRKKDGTTVEGIFLGTGQVVDTMPVEHYRNDYERWRVQSTGESGGKFPPFESSVQIRVSVSSRDEIYAGRFAGFDPGMIRIHSYTRDRILLLKMDYVKRMEDSLGQVTATREEISRVLADGVPVANHLTFKPGILLDGQSGVPFDKIESIVRPEGGGAGKWIGLSAGIVVDIAVAAVAITALVNSMQLDIDFRP